MKQNFVFENINYELSALYYECGGNIHKINDKMLMVPEQYNYPFLKRELDNTAHRLCCELARANASNLNFSEKEICCIVNDFNESSVGIDYHVEDWKIAVILHYYYLAGWELKCGELSDMLTNARLKRIAQLIRALPPLLQMSCNFVDVLGKRKYEETENERCK